MTITQVMKLVQANEDRFWGKKLGDAGHVVTGFEVFKKGEDSYSIDLIGEDGRSGVPVVKKPLKEWLEENPAPKISN